MFLKTICKRLERQKPGRSIGVLLITLLVELFSAAGMYWCEARGSRLETNSRAWPCNEPPQQDDRNGSRKYRNTAGEAESSWLHLPIPFLFDAQTYSGTAIHQQFSVTLGKLSLTTFCA